MIIVHFIRTTDENGSSNPLDSSSSNAAGLARSGDAMKIFDFLDIGDTRIPELCTRAGLPAPFAVLQEYLKRYSTFGDTTIRMNTTRIRHQKHFFELTVGVHSVRVVCSNKLEGKQKAAQALLKKCKLFVYVEVLFFISCPISVYPEGEKWSTVVRLFGHDSAHQKEIQKDRESIVKLQGMEYGKRQKHQSNWFIGEGRNQNLNRQPNEVILAKLRSEMLKLAERQNRAGPEAAAMPNMLFLFQQ